jgi:hypothetical protein
VVKFSDLNDNERKDVEFAYKELNIVDKKANNILLVDSILIVISTLSILFSGEANVYTRIIGTVAVLVTLVSVAMCIRTMKIEWSDGFSVDELKKERDTRTKNIHRSTQVLFSALILYVIMFVVDLVLTFWGNAMK